MRLKNIILLMGPPGSGKGTQSKLLVDKFHYGYFSMGDALREYAKIDTDLGREIKTTIDQGIIVRDEAAQKVFEEQVGNLLEKPGLVLDGFPRTLGQIEVLKRLLDKYKLSFKAFFLEVDKQKLLQRLSLRSKTEGRVDDADIASVEKRFDEYSVKTAPVKQQFETQGNLVHINGDQTVAEVHEEIISKLA